MKSLKELIRGAKTRAKDCAPACSPKEASNAKLCLSTTDYYTISLKSAVSMICGDQLQDDEHVFTLEPTKLEDLPVGVDECCFYRNIVSKAEEKAIVALMESAPQEKWTQLSARALQVWGGVVTPAGLKHEELPLWLHDVVRRINEAGVRYPEMERKYIPEADLSLSEYEENESLSSASDRANHVLFNKYLPGQGIMPHSDGPSYSPCAAILSLNDPLVLSFWRSLADAKEGARKALVSVFMEPRSLLVFRGSLYWDCLHGIEEIHEDVIDDRCINASLCGLKSGQVIKREKPRMSLTLRKVTPVFTKISKP